MVGQQQLPTCKQKKNRVYNLVVGLKSLVAESGRAYVSSDSMYGMGGWGWGPYRKISSTTGLKQFVLIRTLTLQLLIKLADSISKFLLGFKYKIFK